jgi:hypothetical protein
MAHPPRPARAPASAQWRKVFLATLATTSNVTAAAKAAGISTQKVYETRRASAEFNRAWQVALCEGYDLLEFELLQRLRTGEIKPAAGAKKGVRTYENATALRLLAAHRENVMKQRSVRTNQDSEAIILAINAKLERIRQRAIAEGRIVTDDRSE